MAGGRRCLMQDGTSCPRIIDLDTADQPLLRILPTQIENTATSPPRRDARLRHSSPTLTQLPRPLPSPAPVQCCPPLATQRVHDVDSASVEGVEAQERSSIDRVCVTTSQRRATRESSLNPKRQGMILPLYGAAAHLSYPIPECDNKAPRGRAHDAASCRLHARTSAHGLAMTRLASVSPGFQTGEMQVQAADTPRPGWPNAAGCCSDPRLRELQQDGWAVADRGARADCLVHAR